MEFHIARKVRERYGVNEVLFNYAGNVVFANIAASRELAGRVNEVRDAAADPAKAMHASSLFAMGLIDELSHALMAQYRETLDPEVLPAALAWFAAAADEIGVERLLKSFTAQFPNVAVYRGETTVEQWLAGTVDGRPEGMPGVMTNREAAFEELVLLWLANINPAFQPFHEFFDDEELEQGTIYKTVTAKLEDYFATRPEFDPEVGTLLDALKAPMLASPDSLTGQLAFIRERWVEYLGEDVRRVLLAMDMVKEEEIAIWMQFHPPSASKWHEERKPGWGAEGFVGDEFIGFTDARGRRYRADELEQPTVHEYEAFSPDQAWMPTVVLIAKSTYVWLEQLSKKYQRHIHRLDQIPDEEMRLMADRGMNGLWLIGLWERSTASQTIKRLRGQADAVASAYSVADYRIADDLGGEAAYRHLRDQAARAGIRLASDMVPNHMGIDSTWVMEHPEWFVSRQDSPFPVYSFEGPDLSNNPNIEIKIEDHYFDQTDAAVVFRRRERANGRSEYMYHGNDGTTFAWNDTAQLDYSKEQVREQVMQTILQVARLFPIIRFDAAMTLAKKHVQRLWFPIPGVGGSIPSRAESAMSNAEFDALMPNEFWREVVDRVAVEVPGTLLLAEAFWLLEGYFVRTLGMHRVYNSAFMNMLRDEENAKYRSYLKKTIEFDPDILKRYVNFMSNPDERTTIDQFGSGDRCFGVATLLATLPGLPMFGHGQVEGFTEKYGMEYKRARFDESPDEDLVARHQREIAPLLKRRELFAGSSDFFLYDFWTGDGTVDENVYAYSNRVQTQRHGHERAIVFFNNRYGETRGTIHGSAESMNKEHGTMWTRRLGEALHLQADDAIVVAYKDTASGLEYLRRSREIEEQGVTVELRAYQYVVLQGWRELRSSAEKPWDRLCDALGGAGVYNLEEALSKMRVRPLHEAVRHMLSADVLHTVIEVAEETRTRAKVAPKLSVVPVEMLQAPDELFDTLMVEPVVVETPALVEPADGRLAGFFERSDAFLERVKELVEPSAGEGFARQEIRASVDAVIRLPLLARSSATVWPAIAASVLPVGKPGTSSVAIWTPVLAWSVLRHLRVEAKETLRLFDQLQLRTALADAFSSVGLEGESGWCAAARVRVLLAHRVEQKTALQALSGLQALLGSKEFWKDADVRWLAGVGEFEGKTYFNKELFEELVFWMLLPELIVAEKAEPAKPVAGEPVAAKLPFEALFMAAQKAGYEVDELMGLLKPAATGKLAVEAKASEAKKNVVEDELEVPGKR